MPWNHGLKSIKNVVLFCNTLHFHFSLLKPHVLYHSLVFPHVAIPCDLITSCVWMNLSYAFVKCFYLPHNLFCLLWIWRELSVFQTLSPQFYCVLASQGWNKDVHLAQIPMLQLSLSEGATSLSGGFCFSQHFVLFIPSSALTRGVKPLTTVIIFISVTALVSWNLS